MTFRIYEMRRVATEDTSLKATVDLWREVASKRHEKNTANDIKDVAPTSENRGTV